MATKSEIVGWTAARKRRTGQLCVLTGLAAILAVYAMCMPWSGRTTPEGEATCDPVAANVGVPVFTEDGQYANIEGPVCMSALQAVQVAQTQQSPDAPFGSARNALPAGVENHPILNPLPEEKYGLPALSFWLAAAGLMGVLCGLIRNGLFLLPGLLFLKYSYEAFDPFRQHLSSDLGIDGSTTVLAGFTAEMHGVFFHQVAFWAVAVLLVVSGWFVLKVNSEQRQVDGKSHPIVAGLRHVAQAVLRIDEDKVAAAVAAANKKS